MCKLTILFNINTSNFNKLIEISELYVKSILKKLFNFVYIRKLYAVINN